MASSSAQSAKRRRLSARKRLSASRPLKIGTDCSGMDVAVAMLEEILAERTDVSCSVEHVFSCERNPAARAIIEHNFSPCYFSTT